MDLIQAGTLALTRADGVAGAGINSPTGWLIAGGLVAALALVAWWAARPGHRRRRDD